MRKRVKAGLIGCGAISPTHLRAFKENDVELVATCDIIEERAARRAEEYGDPNTRVIIDYHDLLAIDEIELVNVATPPALHASMSIDAMRAGKHVLCEKPCVTSVVEAEEVRRVASETGRLIAFLGSRLRYGMHEVAKRFIDDGDLGDIYRVNVKYYRRRGRPGIDILEGIHWFHDRSVAGAGVLMDMGVYFMDTVIWFTGAPPITAVSASEFRGFDHNLPPDIPFDVEEHANILARTDGDLTYTFDLAWISHHKPVQIVEVLGTKGGLVVQDGDPPLTFCCDKGGPWNWMNTTTDARPSGDGMVCVTRDFIKAMAGDDPGVGSTPLQALRITELSEMAILSGKMRREVAVDELRRY